MSVMGGRERVVGDNSGEKEHTRGGVKVVEEGKGYKEEGC